MSHHELAAVMIFSMAFLFCIVLCADTLPTGRRIIPLGRRAFERLSDGLEKIFGKGF